MVYGGRHFAQRLKMSLYICLSVCLFCRRGKTRMCAHSKQEVSVCFCVYFLHIFKLDFYNSVENIHDKVLIFSTLAKIIMSSSPSPPYCSTTTKHVICVCVQWRGREEMTSGINLWDVFSTKLFPDPWNCCSCYKHWFF